MADEGPRVGAPTRHLVHAFLVVLFVGGIAHLELFPFSAFRLFSELRSSERESWQLRAVDPDGGETSIRLGELPLAYRQTSRLLLGFDDLRPDERDAVCDAWAQPLRDDGADIERVRVYRLVASVRPDGPPPTRTLAYECGTPP